MVNLRTPIPLVLSTMAHFTDGVVVAVNGVVVFVNSPFRKWVRKEFTLPIAPGKLVSFCYQDMDLALMSLLTERYSHKKTDVRVKSGEKEFYIELELGCETDGPDEIRIVFVRDITNRINSENSLLKAKEKAERADRAKSLFLANMSHEIRTPLNSVIGFTGVLISEVTNQHHREYLQAIKKSGETLLELINDVLDLSKIEAGKMELRMEEVDVEGFVNEVFQMFSLRAIEKELTFTLAIEKGFPVFIMTDFMRIRQIVLNLLSNAVKFTPKGEVLMLIRQEKSNAEKWIEIEVQDTGIGIAEPDLSGIFNVFNQISSSSTKRYEGTGLGLNITKRLVELLGGEIKVNSGLGIGSIFSVKLPLIATSSERVFSDQLVFKTGAEKPIIEILSEKDFGDKNALVKNQSRSFLKMIDENSDAKADNVKTNYIFDTANDETVLSNESLSKSADSLSSLSEILLPRIEKARKIFIVKEIEQLVQMVKESGQLASDSHLLMTAEQLSEALRFYDIEKADLLLINLSEYLIESRHER